MKSLRKNPKFQPILSLGCQGNIKAALPLAKELKKKKLNWVEKSFVEIFIKRFDERNPAIYRCSDPLISDLIDIYQNYWLSVLLGEQSFKQGEKWLFGEVSKLMGKHNIQFKKKFNDDYYCKRLRKVIESRNYKCIVGTVVPLQELELWREEETVSYKVKLPESEQTVKTTFLKNFIVRGWMDFATIGVFYPGGWATKDGLHCVSSSYDKKSEKFKVSYLGHEAQHFSDYKKFPKLEQIDLEYRAKLAELALAKRSGKKILEHFSGLSEKNKKSPHAFANFCVVRDISKSIFGSDWPDSKVSWDKVSHCEINQIASELLCKNTDLLNGKGAKSVKRFVQ